MSKQEERGRDEANFKVKFGIPLKKSLQQTKTRGKNAMYFLCVICITYF